MSITLQKFFSERFQKNENGRIAKWSHHDFLAGRRPKWMVQHHSLLWVHFNAVEYCNVQCDLSVDWDITIIPVIVIHPISRLPRSNPPPTRLRPVILLNPNPTIATIFSSCCLLFIG